MPMDINSATKARQFLEFIEAFSFANALTGEVRNENIKCKYDGDFGNYSLNLEFEITRDSKIRIRVRWVNHSIMSRGLLFKDNAFKEKYNNITKHVKSITSSVDDLKGNMNFIVSDFENMNLLIDLLTGDL